MNYLGGGCVSPRSTFPSSLPWKHKEQLQSNALALGVLLILKIPFPESSNELISLAAALNIEQNTFSTLWARKKKGYKGGMAS